MSDRTRREPEGQPDGAALIQGAWQRELPDLPEAALASIGVITRIWRVAGALEVERRRTLDRLGTDASTLDLLSTLRRSGPPYAMRVAEITEASLVTQGAISQRIARAEAAGLVRRAPAPADRRSVVVSLTPKGRRLNERSVRALLDREAELLTALDENERVDLARLLTVLLGDLTARTGRPDRPATDGT